MDDETAFLDTIRDLFTTWSKNSWIITTASSADQALEILKTGQFDLIVVDVNMPVLERHSVPPHPRSLFSRSEKSGHHRSCERRKTRRLPRQRRRTFHRKTAFGGGFGYHFRHARGTGHLEATGGISRHAAPGWLAGRHPDGMPGTQFFHPRKSDGAPDAFTLKTAGLFTQLPAR